MKVITFIPLVIGIIINFIFYSSGFISFGFTGIIPWLLSVGLLGFEVKNRLYNLKNKDKTSGVIFIALICFSILFNLSGFASSILLAEEKNKIADKTEISQEDKKDEIKKTIQSLEKSLNDNNKNLEFYSYTTKQVEAINPIVEKALIRSGALPPEGVKPYRDKADELTAKIEAERAKLETAAVTYEPRIKNIFDMIGDSKNLFKLFFFFFLSVLIALMPSMNLKYLHALNNPKIKEEKIDPIELKVLSNILWFSVTKSGAINSIENLRAYYKNSLFEEFKHSEKVNSALQKMYGVILCHRDSKPFYYPMDGVTKEVFYEKFKEAMNG